MSESLGAFIWVFLVTFIRHFSGLIFVINPESECMLFNQLIIVCKESVFTI